MKKIIRTTIIIALMTGMLTSCNEVPQTSIETEEPLFTTVEDAPETAIENLIIEEESEPIVEEPVVEEPIEEEILEDETLEDNTLTDSEEEEQAAEIAETITTQLPQTITVLDMVMYATQSCNVRDLPSTSGNKMYSLAKDQQVHVIGQDAASNWYLLEDGYFVTNKYLSSTKAAATDSTTTTPSTTTPPTTPAPSDATTTTATTTTGSSTACPHNNTSRELLYTDGLCKIVYHMKEYCLDCGAIVNPHVTEETETVHRIHTTWTCIQSRICGVQDEISYPHYECDCGEICYDGPPVVTANGAHNMVTFQFYDADGNTVEGLACCYCGWQDTSTYHIVAYAP